MTSLARLFSVQLKNLYSNTHEVANLIYFLKSISQFRHQKVLRFNLANKTHLTTFRTGNRRIQLSAKIMTTQNISSLCHLFFNRYIRQLF